MILVNIVILVRVQPGDVVQLWRFNSKGEAMGHAGFIVEVDAPGQRLKLRGAHNRTDGLGDKWFNIGTNSAADVWPYVYIARPKVAAK